VIHVQTNTFEGAARNALDEPLVELAVAIGGRDLDAQLVAGALVGQFPLQAGHQVAVSMQIGERLSRARAVDDFTRIVLQRVVEQYDGVLRDGHSLDIPLSLYRGGRRTRPTAGGLV